MSLKLKFIILLSPIFFGAGANTVKYAVIVSANMEWKAVKKRFPYKKYKESPWGEYFYHKIEGQYVLFFHEGWGKVAAAGATQYVIDTYKPEILINLGTCGGFEGEINRNDVVLAKKTIIYDILEAMGDSKEAIADYTTDVDLSWLGENYPTKVIKSTLVSADKDLMMEEVNFLKREYKAKAGDWESGAIAYTAKRNHTKLLILRGVSDLVDVQRESDTYGNFEVFVQRAEEVMNQLINDLPLWIRYIEVTGKK